VITNTADLTENDSQVVRTDSADLTITCVTPNQGCTPGYWKNHLDAWVGYSPNDLVGDVFGSYFGLGNDTLLMALDYEGGNGNPGAARILLRAGVAALLNASNPNVDYPMSTQDVIDAVNAALASEDRETMLDLATMLDDYNNLGCPLGLGGAVEPIDDETTTTEAASWALALGALVAGLYASATRRGKYAKKNLIVED
jgi:hypothetical protein